MPEVASLTGNVVYDSAASTYLYRFDIFPTVLSLVGSERVLFASDYPVLTQPRFLRRVRDAGIPPHALGDVLGGNAERVFRLPPLSKEAEK
jgi:predicted TIM-barrel fold metal-dependent hydrolase